MNTRETLIYNLQSIVGNKYVVYEPEDLIVFEYDGSVDKAIPLAVVLPNSTEEVSRIVQLCKRQRLPIIPRGAGTGLSGGSIAEQGGVVIALTRMTKILEIDTQNQLAIVEPGLVNIDLSNAVSKHGLYYAPDPSSQKTCTIGGNVAENSGGPHCLAYGVTTNHILGMEVVYSDGSIQWVGSPSRESPGYDLRGILIGSEGTLAIVTKIIVRLLKKPESTKTLLAVFKEVDHASAAVSGIISEGIVPAALEMMDQLCVQAAEQAVHAGYPPDAGAVLLVELDGLKETVTEEAEEVEDICRKYEPIEIRVATDELEREKLWTARKGVIGALGRFAPNYLLADGTVPRTKLVEALTKVREISKRHGLLIANVLHAGDGNLHPCVLFDERKPGDVEKALTVGGEILKTCVGLGGVLSGEHGIGLEKQEYMPLMFSAEDMEAMGKLKPAFSSEGIFNPGKIFPTGAPCADMKSSSAIARTGVNTYI